MKLQVAFRDTGHVEKGYRTVILAGLVEFQDNDPSCPALPEGMIGSFVMDMARGPGGLRPSMVASLDRYRFPKDCWGHRPTAGTDLTAMVTQSVWGVPTCRGHCEMFLLKSLVEPSRPGLAVMAATGIVAIAAESQVDQDGIFQCSWDQDRFVYEGRLGEDLRPEWGAPTMAGRTRGHALRQFLREPVWGFGDEPVSLPWQMPLGFAEQFDEYLRLALLDEKSDEETAAHAELRKRMATEAMDNVDRDPMFKGMLRGLKERGLLRLAAMPMTRDECVTQEKAAAELLREAMDRTETLTPGP